MKGLAMPLGLAGIEAQTGRNRERSFNSRIVLIALLVFAGYYLGAKIGFALTFQPHPVSVLWPSNSILLAALLLTPLRWWWLVLLAALPAHWAVQLQSDVPPPMILCWYISNSFEAVLGAAGVLYLLGEPFGFTSLRNVGIFCICAAFLAPCLSSFLDAAFVKLNHWGHGGYWEIWRIRLTSNVLAALTITPVIITWANSGIALFRKISPRRFLEAGILFGGLVAVSFIVFYKIESEADSALLYLPLPFLLWAAVRFGSRGLTTGVCIVAFLTIWGAAHGHGPFSEKSPEANALSVQMFLIVMSVPLMFLAALVEERVTTDATLRGREERIRLAAESGNLAFWTIDFEQKQSWMSESGRAIFNFAPNESLSRELFLSRVHPEDRVGVDEAIERARIASETFEVEYRLLRPDGETRWLISRGRYLRSDRGRASELIGVAIDVTAQVKANLQLRLQREEMAHLGRVAVMGELTASLAHELNQPLTAIASNAAAGKRFLANDEFDAKDLNELLDDVAADARRAGNVIHGIHHFVRKSEGTRSLVNVNDIIREVLRLLHSDLLGRSAAVETQLAPNLALVKADPIQLQQILLNLLMNSLEAMHQTPANNRRIVITTIRKGDSVLTSVRDFGTGLPKDGLEKIFTHFYSTKPSGMGMGLTIVRSIVESHGGELDAEDTDQGARFLFTLPVAAKTA